MPQYFDKVSIGKMYGINGKDVSKILKAYKDVIKSSVQSTDVKYYALENTELINEIYHKTIIGKLEKQIREELKLPQKKEKIKIVESTPTIEFDEKPENSMPSLKIKGKPVKRTLNINEKDVNSILFDLFKARLEEYHENGIITKSQLNELMEYEKSKLIGYI